MSVRYDLPWRAAKTPDAPALETPACTWTFVELFDLARRGAAHVRATAPQDDAPVGLLLDGDAEFAAWFHAIALAGRTVLPLNLRLTTRELAQQLADARVGWLLGKADDARLADLAEKVAGLRCEIAPKFGVLPAPHGAMPGESGSADRGTALAVLFTSGTSGRAKGACLTRANFLASAEAAADRLGPVVAQRWLACMPLFHVGGLSILMRSVRFGGPVRLLPRFDAAEVSDVLDGGDVAAVSLVPTMLSRLLSHREGRAAPPGLRVLLLGGAAAAPELLTRALAAGYPVCPTYGLTESCSQVATAAPPPVGAACALPMLPLRGTELRIDIDGRDAPPGTPGEIVVRGPTVMQGYLHDPQSTAWVLRAGWLYTGDIGCLDSEGGLRVLDRRDDLIVSGGENVYPAEIEAVLLEHPSVDDAGVAGVPDADLGARVVAWVVAAPGKAPDVEALQRHCRSRLAGFKQPREIRYVDALPRNAAGKLQRSRLREPSTETRS
ncbi:MAG: o-succinylbenzoate---CoA ligase [Pseudomonadota bacterium]|nr:o-succinylbenzoate---CoA ligase [Pseudomonadota bacterium]